MIFIQMIEIFFLFGIITFCKLYSIQYENNVLSCLNDFILTRTGNI